jgi:GNAT superfamily N-acetyltransferase
VPQGVVLLEDGAPAGTASLDHADLDTRPDLTPWLANVFVAPEFRGRGHARRLVRYIEAASRTGGGTEVLYLHTEDAMALYAGPRLVGDRDGAIITATR